MAAQDDAVATSNVTAIITLLLVKGNPR